MFQPFVRFLPALFAVFSVQSALGALKVGDDAPNNLPGKWAQGEAVKGFEGDKVYIIEFWATWCGPCISAIPHINDIYKKNKSKGLVVIGQNLGEDEKTVSDFVKKMGSKMTYRVGVDDSAGTMGKKWLTAAGQNGIPCAFVVNKKGKVAYIGHPMSMDESMLAKLLSEPSTKPPGEPAGGTEDKSTTLSPKASELANLAAKRIAAGEFDKAEAAIAELNGSLTENFMHVGALLQLDLMIARKQNDDVLEFSKILAEDFAKNTKVLNALAATLVSKPDADAKLQSAAAKIATPLSEGEDPYAALTTLARVAFLGGDKEQAVELQTKAVAAAPAAESDAAKKALDEYKQGRLP